MISTRGCSSVARKGPAGPGRVSAAVNSLEHGARLGGPRSRWASGMAARAPPARRRAPQPGVAQRHPHRIAQRRPHRAQPQPPRDRSIRMAGSSARPAGSPAAAGDKRASMLLVATVVTAARVPRSKPSTRPGPYAGPGSGSREKRSTWRDQRAAGPIIRIAGIQRASSCASRDRAGGGPGSAPAAAAAGWPGGRWSGAAPGPPQRASIGSSRPLSIASLMSPAVIDANPAEQIRRRAARPRSAASAGRGRRPCRRPAHRPAWAAIIPGADAGPVGREHRQPESPRRCGRRRRSHDRRAAARGRRRSVARRPMRGRRRSRRPAACRWGARPR